VTYYTPTTYYPPTTAYTTYWTPTSIYTTCYTQNEVIVTITSYIPCPTSTVIYYTYECNECQTQPACNDCCDGSNYNCCPNQHCYGYSTGPYDGTTTVTLQTTVPPQPVQTITSNGVVVVVMDTGSYVQTLAATDQVQVVSGLGVPVRISWIEIGVSMVAVMMVAALMVAL
jgi:hypothetical protein